MAVETWPNDVRNPLDFTGAGTPSFEAPEQIDVEDEDYQSPLLSAKTDVFGVGITVMTLMSRWRGVGVEDSWSAARKGSQNPRHFPHLTHEEAADYSDDLVSVVTLCVEYEQDDRPSFKELQETISYFTQGTAGFPPGKRGWPEHDLAEGMRMEGDPLIVGIGLKLDRWAVGSPLIPVSPSDEDEDEDEDEEDEDED